MYVSDATAPPSRIKGPNREIIDTSEYALALTAAR
jgi:hypothetical protein